MIKRDKDKKLYYAPLEGETFKEKKVPTIEDETIIIYTKNQVLYKSDAVICTLELLGGFWLVIATLMKIFPKIFRDFIYDLIGKLRYRFAGKVDEKTCPLLPKAYQERMLT